MDIIIFLPFAYLAACVGTAIEDAKNLNRLSLTSSFLVAEEIAGGGVVGESDRCYVGSRAPGREIMRLTVGEGGTMYG